MDTQIIDIADLDCIYLSYDEPKKEEFWIQIQNMVPWADRVDGVKGSDAAHKAAAAKSNTEWFVLIDGDNLPDPEFFNLQLEIEPAFEDGAFRWKAKNVINGLRYGNGGLRVWSRAFVNNMQTHEASDGSDDTAVEFCFDPKYIAMHNCYSTTYPNGTPKQAWRAGFREGVKLATDRGVRILKEELKNNHWRCLHWLYIWSMVGKDVEYGEWAILGTRAGLYMTMCTDWDYVQVRDFKYLNDLWKVSFESIEDVDYEIEEYGIKLINELDIPIAEQPLDAQQSKFFKSVYQHPSRTDHQRFIEKL